MPFLFCFFHGGYVLKHKNDPVGRGRIVGFCALSCLLCVAGPVSATDLQPTKPQAIHLLTDLEIFEPLFSCGMAAGVRSKSRFSSGLRRA